MQRFLQLPKELREEILEYVALQDPAILQHTGATTRVLPGSGILLASKQLHREYKDALRRSPPSTVHAYHITLRHKLSPYNGGFDHQLLDSLNNVESLYIELVYDCTDLDMEPEISPLACTSSTYSWPRRQSVRDHFLCIRRDISEGQFMLWAGRQYTERAWKRVAVNISFAGLDLAVPGTAGMLPRLGAKFARSIFRELRSVSEVSVLGPGGIGHYSRRQSTGIMSTDMIRWGVLYTGLVAEWRGMLRDLKAERCLSQVLAYTDSAITNVPDAELHKAVRVMQLKLDKDVLRNRSTVTLTHRKVVHGGLSQTRTCNPFAALGDEDTEA